MTAKKKRIGANQRQSAKAVRIYLKQNVLEAAKDRIRWVFSEFPIVVVGTSGGKDSVVIYHLALEVAREMDRLPLKVMFLDQEAEWQATIDTVRSQMEHPDVDPMWMQIPFRLFNATSTTEHWLKCWDPAEEGRWMRPKEPYAYAENRYGQDRFGGMFRAIFRGEFGDTPAAYLAGVRTEESPARFIGLTGSETWKGRTWGKTLDANRHHFTFYPIYDWSYTDVWKAIHEHGWRYNAIYDAQYAYGLSVKNMRVSNVHHETAVHSLFYMQELEPDTYERLTQRIEGIDMAGKLGTDDYFVSELPFMFSTWREYRDYLLDKLVTDEDWRKRMARMFQRQDDLYGEHVDPHRLHRLHIASILTNDWEGIKLDNWERMPATYALRRRLEAEREKEASSAEHQG